MKSDTCEFLLDLLNRVSVSAADDNLEQVVAQIVRAKQELAAEINVE